MEWVNQKDTESVNQKDMEWVNQKDVSGRHEVKSLPAVDVARACFGEGIAILSPVAALVSMV